MLRLFISSFGSVGCACAGLYIYIYYILYICVCVCVWVRASAFVRAFVRGHIDAHMIIYAHIIDGACLYLTRFNKI